MPRVRPLEVKALLPLLKQDWDSVEELTESLILALDEVRASRVSYVGIIQIGGKDGFCMGIGPYPGRKSAEKALAAHPAAQDPTLCTGLVVAAIETPEGFEKRLKELDRGKDAA